MSTLLTTIDLGNTRGKVCDWWLEDAGPAVRVRGEAVEAPWIPRWLASQRSGWTRRVVALSSVADRGRERSLADELASAFGASFVGTPDSGLDNRVRAPDEVGRDRLFAARGAFELVGGSALILDVGTALTVNALSVDRTSPRPRFLGGAIAPGPRLLAEALARGTARLPDIEPRAGVAALGLDTRGAIESGVAHGLRGAARELAARVGEEAQLDGAPVLVTGGARAFLRGVAFDGRRAHEVEDLVHIGLACAALDAASGAKATTRHGRWSLA